MLELLAVLAGLFVPPVAAADRCAPYAHAIALDFETLRPPVRVNNALNVTAIRDMIRGQIEPGLDAHREALGVTVSRPVLSLDARTRIELRVNGLCVYLESVHAEFGFRNLDVYVASEYPPDTCEHRAILDHENQHVAIARDALTAHAGQMRLNLERILGEQRPVLARDGQRATRAILDDIAKRANSELDAFYGEMDARNRVIDSQPNYEAIAEICKNWNRKTTWPQRP
jgi:hypothetical protein